MKRPSRISVRFTAAVAFVLFSSAGPATPQDQWFVPPGGSAGYNPYMYDEISAHHVYNMLIDIKNTVGREIVVMGSSTSATGNSPFRDPLLGGSSDFDIRIVSQPGDTIETLYKKWVKARAMLRNRVLTRQWNVPNANVNNLLKRVQFHPPDEVLQGCASKQDVANRLQDLANRYNGGRTVVPELAREEKLMTQPQIEATLDAIYGGDAVSARKTIEASRGFVIKMDTKALVAKPSADLIPGEPYPTYTLSGQIKNADSWLEHVEDGFRESDPKLVKKNLERVAANLRKSSSMYNSEYGAGKELIPLSEWNVNTDNWDDLRRLYAEMRFRQRMMENLNNARLSGNSQDVALIEKLLRQEAESKGFFPTFSKLFSKAPLSEMMAALRIMYVTYAAYDCINGYREKGELGLAQAIMRNLSLAGALTDAGLQAVKNAVVGSAANLECKDLAKGIVTVHGYESEGEGLDLEKLAAMIPEYGLESSDDPKGMDKAGKLQQEIDEAFKGKVFPLIRSYIDGKFVKGREATALDKEMSEAVMSHCESYLTGEIEKLRKETIQKKKDLLKEVRSNLESVKITGYGSNRTRPVTDEVVGLEVRLSVADLDGFIKTQEKKLQEMGAGDVWLRPEYSWKVSPLDDRGKKGTIGASNANSRLTSLWKFKFKEAGDYRLQAVIDIKSSEKIFGRWGEISVTLSKDFTLKLLPGAASFTACVVNEKGEAVQNASLRLDGPPKMKPLVEMAEKGCCTFEKVVPDQYSLHVEAKGYPSKSVPFDFRHPEKVAKPFKITLAAGLAALQVQVRQVIDTRQTQKPVPGAQVTVEAAEGQFKGAKALLEQEGGKHVTELTPGKYLLRAGAPGYRAPDGKDAVTESLEIPSPTSEKERKTVEKTLFLAPTQGEMSVVVLEKGGESKTIPDAEVKLIQPDGSSRDFQRVDGSGRVVFKDLNPGTNYAVQARAEFYKGPVSRDRIVLDSVKPEQSTAQPIQVLLSPYTGEVQVTVQDGNGQAVEGALVRLGDRSAVSDGRGMAAFSQVAPSGKKPYDLFAEMKSKGYPPARETLEVLPRKDGQVFTKTIRLQSGGRIMVEVKDAETGTAVPHADVQLSHETTTKAERGDSSGYAVFKQLPIGFYYVRASKEGYLPVEKDVELEITVDNPQKAATVRLVQGMDIKVWVWEGKDKLIPGSTVSMDGGQPGFAATGTLVFPRVRRGSHTFSAKAKGYSETSVTFQAEPEKQSSAAVNIFLRPAMTIVAEVYDNRNNLLDNAEVTLSKDGADVSTLRGKAPLFANLGKGSYQVRASAPGYEPGSSSSITLEGGEGSVSQTLTVRLVPYKAILLASVAATGGQENEKPPEISITVSGPESFSGRGPSASFSGLSKGSYKVSASASGYGSDSTTLDVSPSQAGQTYSVGLTLKKGQAPKQEPKKEDDAKKPPEGKKDEGTGKSPAAKQEEGAQKAVELKKGEDTKEPPAGKKDSEIKGPAQGPAKGAPVDDPSRKTAGDVKKLLEEGKVEEAKKLLKDTAPDQQSAQKVLNQLTPAEQEKVAGIEPAKGGTESGPGGQATAPGPGMPPGSKVVNVADLEKMGKKALEDEVEKGLDNLAKEEDRYTAQQMRGVLTAQGSIDMNEYVGRIRKAVQETIRPESVSVQAGSSPIALRMDPGSGSAEGRARMSLAIAFHAEGMSLLCRIKHSISLDGTYSRQKDNRSGTVSGTAQDSVTLSLSLNLLGSEILLASEPMPVIPTSWSGTVTNEEKSTGNYVLDFSKGRLGKFDLAFAAAVSKPGLSGDVGPAVDLDTLIAKDEEADRGFGAKSFDGWAGGDRNRFKAELKGDKLIVSGDYYHDELRRFSDPMVLQQVSGVTEYQLDTAPIENLSNAGFLVYSTKSGDLKYMVLGLDSTVHYGSQKVYPQPVVKNAGTIVSSGCKAGSVRLEIHARAARVYWTGRQGPDSGWITKESGYIGREWKQ